MKEYLNIARAVSHTYSRIYNHHKDDLYSVALLESVVCFNNGTSLPLTVSIIRNRLYSYIQRERKHETSHSSAVEVSKSYLKFHTEATPQECAYMLNYAYKGKHTLNKRDFKKFFKDFKEKTFFYT